MKYMAHNMPAYLLIVLGFITLFVWWNVFSNERGDVLTVSFLDVGQGDAIFIEAPNGNQVLIDGGANRAVLRELSSVMPFFDRSIDVVIATHPDADHIGGLFHVLTRYDVDFILRSGVVNETGVFEALNTILQEKNILEIVARQGMRVVLDEGIHLDVLFPDRDVSGVEVNAASIVTQLVYKEHEFLFTGDAPRSIEDHLVHTYGDTLQSEVLKVGHHGSRTSSSEFFVGYVSPEYAVVSAGCGNQYGHPHEEVRELFLKMESILLTTCDLGTITFSSDGVVLKESRVF
jgi:competence protein ComEC